MGTIAESRAAAAEKLASGQWKYVEPVVPPPAVPAPVTAYPAAPNQYLRAPLPADMWEQPDGQRQFHSAAIPQTRISPLPDTANPVVGALAASIASTLIAANNAASVSPTVTDTDIISRVNRQLFGSLDSFQQQALSVGNGGSASINSISINGTATGANEVVVTTAVGGNNGGQQNGITPGAGWTQTSAGSAVYWKVFPTAGPLTVGQAFGQACFNALQSLLILKTNGSVPVFTNRGGGSGGTSQTSTVFTPGAGTSLLWTVQSASTVQVGTPLPFITDTVGLKWQLITNINLTTVTGGITDSVNIVQYYAQNVPATSMQTTLNIPSTGGNWSLTEISNVSNVGFGAYTFQSSDNLQLVQFGGGANVTGTLPSPALAAGWQALVSNNGGGNVTLSSAALINDSTNSVVIGPGGSTWVFSDGTNYWTTTISTPPTIAKVAHKWLDSYDAFGETFGQSQPAATDLSNGTTGSGTTVLATSPTLTTPTLLGCTLANTINVNNIFAKYNNIATVANGVPAEYATVDNTTATANIGSTVLYAVPASGLYRISYYVIVNRVATISSTLPDLQFTWTDPDNSTVQTFGPVDSATPSANTLTTTYSGTVIISAKAPNNINYQTGVTTAYASSGATTMQYSVHLKLESL
jgi:hypothetical protein